MFNNNELVNINCIVNRFSSELEALDASIEELDNLELNNNLEETVAVLMTKLDEVRQFKKYWRDYTRSYKLAVERDISSRDKKIKDLEVENMKIKTENQQLRKNVDKLEKDNIDKLNALYNKLEDADEILTQIKEQEKEQGKALKEIKSKFDAVDNIVNKVDKAKGFFINQEAVKEKAKVKVDRHGKNAPAFRQDVDNSAIKADFENGMSISELADRYGMTYQGMKYRVNKIKETLEIRGGNE